MITDERVERIIKELWNKRASTGDYVMIDAVSEWISREDEIPSRVDLAARMKRVALRRGWDIQEGGNDTVGVWLG